MAYQRNPNRGPGSNQYGDKPPVPLSPFDQQFRQQRAAMLRGALSGLDDGQLPAPLDLTYFHNEQSGLSPAEWEAQFTVTAEKFLDGKMGAQGMLFGLMQYTPPGATFPDHLIAGLGEKLSRDGLFPYDFPEEHDSHVSALTAAFDRALYTRLYTDAYKDETRVLSAMDASEAIVGQARHLVAYLGERNADPRLLASIVADASGKVAELEELAVGDTRERSHLKAHLHTIKKDLDVVGTDRRRVKEHAFAVENYATLIDKQVRGEYVLRSPFWMEAVHNRSFFALRNGNYPSIEQHLEEIDAMARKAFECTSSLPVRESTSRKRQLKRVQRAIRNTQQAMAPYANEGDEPFRVPAEVERDFAELRDAIFA